MAYDPPIEDEISDDEEVYDESDSDVNAPIDIQFAQYHSNVTFFDMKEAIRYQIEKELEGG